MCIRDRNAYALAAAADIKATAAAAAAQVKSGAFTPASGVEALSAQIKQIGRVVYVKFSLAKAVSGQVSELGTISGVDFPETYEHILCRVSYPAPTMDQFGYGDVDIWPDGTVHKSSGFPTADTFGAVVSGYYLVDRRDE